MGARPYANLLLPAEIRLAAGRVGLSREWRGRRRVAGCSAPLLGAVVIAALIVIVDAGGHVLVLTLLRGCGGGGEASRAACAAHAVVVCCTELFGGARGAGGVLTRGAG